MVEPYQDSRRCKRCGAAYLGHPASWYCYQCNPRPEDSQTLVSHCCKTCKNQFFGYAASRYCQSCNAKFREKSSGQFELAGVYKIQNLISGKIYVGQSIDIHTRWKAHKHQLRSGKHKKSLQADYDLYGPEAFVFEILELLKSPTPADLHYCESFWASHHQSFLPERGYNDADPALRTSRKVTVELSVEDLYVLHRLFQKPREKEKFLSQVISTVLKTLSRS